MPSRFFYSWTVDGYLEKNEQEPPSTQPRENGSTIGVDESYSWSKDGDILAAPASEMDSLAAQFIDIIPENMLLDNAPIEQGNIPSIPGLNDLPSSPLELITMDPIDPVWKSYRSHSLKPSEIRELRAIAMPYHAHSTAPKAEEEEFCPSLRADSKAQGKKRKSSMNSEEIEPVDPPQTRKQQGHNAIEKRYRSNLNDKIFALRQSVPSLRTTPEGIKADSDAEEEDGSVPKTGNVLRKAEILTGAVAYIGHLEGAVERLGDDVIALKSRVMTLEKLAMSDSIVMSNGSNSRAPVMETLQTIQEGKLRTRGDFAIEKLKADFPPLQNLIIPTWRKEIGKRQGS